MTVARGLSASMLSYPKCQSIYDHDSITPTPTKPPTSAPEDALRIATPAMTATTVAMTKDSASGHARYVLSTTWPIHKTFRVAAASVFFT